jgi:hypothetical protein
LAVILRSNATKDLLLARASACQRKSPTLPNREGWATRKTLNHRRARF